MKTSPTVAAIGKALLLALDTIGPIAKESWNPDTKSKYVSLNVVMEVVRPALSAVGVLIIQGCSLDDADPAFIDVETTLLHATSGEWMANLVRIPLTGRRSSKADGGSYPPDPQSAGAALSYGKRYGLLSILGLVADEDDDGQGAKPGTARAVVRAREEAMVGQAGEVLLDEIMPVGGPTQKGKPIKSMPTGVLRAALQSCRVSNKKNELRIIAAELTRRAMTGEKKAEEVLRAEARESDVVAEVAEEAYLKAEAAKDTEGV